MFEVRELTAGYSPENPIVERLSFSLELGETVGLCGTSGCGKTTILRAILGMLKYYGGYAEGAVLYKKQNLLRLSEKEWRKIRWKEIALVAQSVTGSFNPVFTIERTFAETLKVHKQYKAERITASLEEVKLDKKVLLQYPHELSGGMKQRASIALALSLRPDLLLLDESTSGLDVLTEADILKLLWELQRKKGLSILFISHDRRIVTQFCHRTVLL
jgi:peptide/nickel transport system ATP-binding protein